MDLNKYDYFLETTTYSKMKPISGEVNQIPSPQLPKTTHLSIRLHTEIDPPRLMMANTQLGASEPPLIAMTRSDLSLISIQQQAKALAVATIQAIYEGDISKPAILMAEMAEMADMLDKAFFAIGSGLKESVANEVENAYVEGRWKELMELEKGLGERSYGNMLLNWQKWNRA
jgi:hypothetical protein